MIVLIAQHPKVLDLAGVPCPQQMGTVCYSMQWRGAINCITGITVNKMKKSGIPATRSAPP